MPPAGGRGIRVLGSIDIGGVVPWLDRQNSAGLCKAGITEDYFQQCTDAQLVLEGEFVPGWCE